MATGKSQSDALTLLVTCAGRRVELLRAFSAAARRLGVKLRIIAVDSEQTAPALYVADSPILVPAVDHADYIPQLLELIKQHAVDALIPTTDTDLPKLSAARDDFEAAGCTALIAKPDVIRTCRDKTLTHDFLAGQGIDTPVTYTPAQVKRKRTLEYPLLVKPRTGSASHHVHKIADAGELEYHLAHVPDPIVQEFVDGVEHTLDVYVGLTGEARCVVPRRRLQVRGGEVSKGMTVKDDEIMQVGKRVVDVLGPSQRGVVTLQCIVTADRRIRFIEINPRVGGGMPLAIAAGADIPGWLIQELRGQTPTIAFDGWQDRLCMLRYDWSVFVAESEATQPAQARPLHHLPEFE